MGKDKRPAVQVIYKIERIPAAQKDVSFDGKKQRGLFALKMHLLEKFEQKKFFQRKRGKKFARGKIRPLEWLPIAGIVGAAAAGLAVCVAVVLLVMNMTTTNVTINDSGRIVKANTTEKTVGELLSKNGIALDDNDVLEVSLSAKLQEDMEIVIRRANTITISDEGGDTQIKMLAGTVGEALERAGIVLESKDEVYPDAGTYVYAGMKINVIRVDVKYEKQTEILEYKEITKESKYYDKGKRILGQPGVTGEQEHTIEIVYKNGKEYSREIIDTTVISEPQDEIIYIGTYVEPTPEPTKKPTPTKRPDTDKKEDSDDKKEDNKKEDKEDKEADTGANNEKDDDGKLTKAPSIEQIHSGIWEEHAAVPEPASSLIEKTVIATRITAYDLCKNPTATGTRPRIGTVAANPRQIPYGTKIYVPGYGYGRIEDTGSNKHSLDQLPLDVWLPTHAECIKWGSRKNVKVYILK